MEHAAAGAAAEKTFVRELPETSVEEIVAKHSGTDRVRKMFELRELVSQQHGNVLHISPSLRFRLIAADADADKFADCAIAA